MSKIFISYQRDKTSGITGRIFDRLKAVFGKERLFKDVDSIPFGVDFVQHIGDVLEQCKVVLVIIGPR